MHFGLAQTLASLGVVVVVVAYFKGGEWREEGYRSDSLPIHQSSVHKIPNRIATMTIAMPTTALAFAVARPLSRNMASTTSLSAVSNASFQQAALGFFGGIRLPASLIAGSSVAAVFSLTRQAKDVTGLNKAEIVALRLYHAVAILSLCLSMTTISITTSASTLLLLGKFDGSSYPDAYHFLRGEMNFEFVLTRWAFLCSIILFLTGVASRLLLELDLLKESRRTGGLLVVFTMAGALTGMIANINASLHCWPNLILMTKELIQVRSCESIALLQPTVRYLTLALSAGSWS